MKLKSKLIISFCIILFVPIFLAGIVSVGFLNIQVKLIEENYGLQNADMFNITNVVQLLNRYTTPDFEELIQVSEERPSKLEYKDYL